MSNSLKSNKGSVLVFSLIVLSIVLSAALSVAVVNVSNRKSAGSTGQSVQSFQVADSGVEKALKEIYKGSYTDLSNMRALITGSTLCSNGSFSFPVSGGTSTVTFFDTDNVLIDCASTDWRNDVAKIKVEGTSAGTTRVIETAIAAPGCSTPTVTDIDGNIYNTVRVNGQCWMKESIMTTKYPDGTNITRGSSSSGWANGWDDNDHGYYAYPPNVANTAEESLVNIRAGKLGFVYQRSAAMHGSITEGAQGICPSGWHIPTSDDYTRLERSICTSGGCATDFPFNTSTFGWRGTNEGAALSVEVSGGTNSSGFAAHLAGVRLSDGGFESRGTHIFLWTSSMRFGSDPSYRILYSPFTTIARDAGVAMAGVGLSVRCIKD